MALDALEASVVVYIFGPFAGTPKLAPARWGVKLSLSCAGIAMLSACASGGGQQAQSVNYYASHASHNYAPPGPPSDPWGPYINEASAQFDVPAPWIRQVMRVESGGHEYINGQLTESAAGAMGLMQLEPETYREMAEQYGLGSDPFDPRDNIMAGTAYIHAMYQIYGSPGFLAAYDAGPGRLNSYMTYHTTLPDETVNYVAMIAPHIQGYYPQHRSQADELALNTLPMGDAPGILPPGFVPDSPSPASMDGGGSPVQVAENEPPAAVYAPASSALAEPSSLPLPPPALPSVVATTWTPPAPAMPPPPPPPPHGFSVIPEAMADTLPSAPPPRPSVSSYLGQPRHSGWAIQVGAYDTSSNARAALGIAELSAVQMLMGGHPLVVSVHAEGHVKYRARFVGLMRDDAMNACSRLSGGPTGCVVLPPDEQS